MNDEEFKLLKLEIQKAMNALETLQGIYLRETGRRFISGQGTGQQTVQADADKLASIIIWLENNQPDVFSRGIWDAIRTA